MSISASVIYYDSSDFGNISLEVGNSTPANSIDSSDYTRTVRTDDNQTVQVSKRWSIPGGYQNVYSNLFFYGVNSIDIYNAEFSSSTFSFVGTYEKDFDDDYVEVSGGNFSSYILILPHANSIKIGTLTNCTCNYANNDKISATKNIVVTANDGYFFDEEYQYKYGDSYKYFTLSTDKKTLTIDTSNIVYDVTVGNITAISSEEPQVYTINISGLQNCTSNYTNGQEISATKNLVITANDGYVFDNDTYSYTENDVTKFFVKSNDNSTLTANFANVEGNVVVSDIVATKVKTDVYTLTIGILTNCTCNYKNGDIIDKSKNIIITANENYYFKDYENGYKYYIGNTGFSFSKSSDNKTLTAVMANINNNVKVDDITADAVRSTWGTIHITGSIVNATCNYNDGDELIIGKPIILTPNEGYEFTGYYNIEIDSVDESIEASADGTIVYQDYEEIEEVYLNKNYTATKVSETSQFTNIYIVTNKILDSLSKVRFVDENEETVDTGKFIVNLQKGFYKIPSSVLGDTADILLGKYNTGVSAQKIIKDDFNVDYGSIVIPKKYNNCYDYINTICTLYFPLFNPINIDPIYCIGQTIKLLLNVNFYSKKATLKIYSTFNNDEIFYNETTVFNDIPFYSFVSNYLMNNYDSNNINLFDTPYIIVERNDNYQSSNSFGRETVTQDTLKNYKGFTKVNDIKLNTFATKNECQEIKNLLQKGVII